ncbi:helix-turn-helix domain-containing protein [Planctomycetota bacterium]
MGNIKQQGSQPNREWLSRMADIEDSCESVAVGGMVEELGMLHPVTTETPRVLGRLIEYARRAKGMSVEKLADVSKVDLAEIVSIERDEDTSPATRTIYLVAEALNLPAEKLLELSGLMEPTDKEQLSQAAIRFAAQSEPMGKLSRGEREAYEAFVKVLVEGTD